MPLTCCCPLAGATARSEGALVTKPFALAACSEAEAPRPETSVRMRFVRVFAPKKAPLNVSSNRGPTAE